MSTYPIFWLTANGWRPLLSHRDDEQPKLIEARRGLARGFNKFTAAELPPEACNALIREFGSHRIAMGLIPAFEELNLGTTVVFELLDLVKKLKNYPHEKKQVRAAFLVTRSERAKFYTEASRFDIDRDLGIGQIEKAITIVTVVRRARSCHGRID